MLPPIGAFLSLFLASISFLLAFLSLCLSLSLLSASCLPFHLSCPIFPLVPIPLLAGLNYVLAPFFLIGPSIQPEDVFCMFSAFISRIMPATFTDDEFGSLQCAFRMFRLLIRYHDPVLCSQLDRYDMDPEVRGRERKKKI